MQVTFTRREGGGSTAEFRRPDGVTVRIRSYDRKHRIPHDLAHLVAERAFRVERGVWGSLAAGVLFASAEVVAGRRRHDDKARSAALLKANKDETSASPSRVATSRGAAGRRARTGRETTARALAEAWGSVRTPDRRRATRRTLLAARRWTSCARSATAGSASRPPAPSPSTATLPVPPRPAPPRPAPPPLTSFPARPFVGEFRAPHVRGVALTDAGSSGGWGQVQRASAAVTAGVAGLVGVFFGAAAAFAVAGSPGLTVTTPV